MDEGLILFFFSFHVHVPKWHTFLYTVHLPLYSTSTIYRRNNIMLNLPVTTPISLVSLSLSFTQLSSFFSVSASCLVSVTSSIGNSTDSSLDDKNDHLPQISSVHRSRRILPTPWNQNQIHIIQITLCLKNFNSLPLSLMFVWKTSNS